MHNARKSGRSSAAKSAPASAQTSQAGKWAPAILSTGSQPESPAADTAAHAPTAYRFSIGAVPMPPTLLRTRLGSVMTTPAALLGGHLLIEVEIRRRTAGNQSRPTIERQVLDRPLDENQNATLELD